MALPLPGGIQLRCLYVCLVAFAVGLIWSLVTGFVIWKPIVLVVWCVLPVVWIVSALSIDPKGRAVLVTGCDSGFGHHLAKYLHRLGFHVFAGCLLADEGQGAQTLRQMERHSDRLHVLALDITSEASVQQATRYVAQHLPPGGLWALVNNAGIGGHGYIEWTSLATYEKVASVNLFGTIRMTKAMLPLIRQSQGRIVNVSSTLGRQSGPFMSAYSITKFAIEAFSDSLRQELSQFKVKVCVVEPGNHIAGTNICVLERVHHETMGMWNALEPDVRSAYGEHRLEECIALNKQFITCGRSDVTPVINSLVDAVCRVYPETRYVPATWITRLLFFLGYHLPDFVNDFCVEQFPFIKSHT